jgi:hypothetical protein
MGSEKGPSYKMFHLIHVKIPVQCLDCEVTTLRSLYEREFWDSDAEKRLRAKLPIETMARLDAMVKQAKKGPHSKSFRWGMIELLLFGTTPDKYESRMEYFRRAFMIY